MILDPKEKLEFKYLLGKEHKKDTKGGDAGRIFKRAENSPTVDFIRSSFNGKCFNSLQHSDVIAASNSKTMKTYYVTTGLVVAYKNTFEVQVYNIQSPVKETCPQDFTEAYFAKVVVQRRLAAAKKKDTSLMGLIQ